MCVAIIGFPFLVHGHSFLNFHCKTHSYLEGCESEHFDYMFEVVILNSFLSLLTLALVLFAIFKSRTFTPHLSTVSRVERRLILQTIFSSTFQIFYYFFFTFNIFCTTCDLDTLMGTSFVFYVGQHYSSMIIMLVISSRMRADFFKFYKIDRFFKKPETSFFVIKTVSRVSSS